MLPSFEIYGGVSGLVDYGPVGARIKRKVMDNWIDHWTSHGDIVEVDSPTITPEPVLIASGHVGEFNDLMVECGGCGGACSVSTAARLDGGGACDSKRTQVQEVPLRRWPHRAIAGGGTPQVQVAVRVRFRRREASIGR